MPGSTDTGRRPGGRWDEISLIQPDKGGAAQGTSEASSLDTALKNIAADDSQGEPSYYGISPLKPPVWTPEVGVYFFLGGVSGGAFVLARLAEYAGGARLRTLTRVGTAVAVAAALPCAPLLVWDLGDPKRFLHMLRVWKPGSPMNLGSWALSGYTVAAVLAGGREWLRARRRDAPPEGAAKFVDGGLTVAADAGIPMALTLFGYTGVLLSTTAVPLWGRNPWLGALFSAGAVSSGASAIRLALEAFAGKDEAAAPAQGALAKTEVAARVAEAVTLAGFLAAAGKFAGPLTKGPEALRFWVGAVGAGLALPTILEDLPASKKAHRWLGIAAGVSTLVGIFALRTAITSAGHPSASDPDDARKASRTQERGGIA